MLLSENRLRLIQRFIGRAVRFRAGRFFAVSLLWLSFFSSQVYAFPITEKGQALQRFLRSQKVESLWQPHQYINWKTGEQIFPSEQEIEDQHLQNFSHCSAYVAALASRLAVPFLNAETSPQGNMLLANNQNIWLHSEQAVAKGWASTDEIQAQRLANQGDFVVASIRNENPHKPGHIAIVVPDDQLTETELEESGPTVTQAGSPSEKVPQGNTLATDTVSAFDHHTHGTLEGIEFFEHEIDFDRLIDDLPSKQLPQK